MFINKNESSNVKLLHSIEDVKYITSLGKTSIYEAIKSGDLIVKKFGSKSLVTKESLDAFIKSLPIVGGDHDQSK